MQTCWGLVVLAVVIVLHAAPAHAAGRIGIPKTQPASIDALTSDARGTDLAKTDAALAALRLRGQPGETALRRILPQIIAADGSTISRLAKQSEDPGKLRSAEKELEQARQSAWDNLNRLGRDRSPDGGKPQSAKAARRNYDRLAALLGRVRPIYAVQWRLIKAVSLRRKHLDLLGELSPAQARPFDAETALIESAVEKAIDAPLSSALALANDSLDPPDLPQLRGLWHHVACRRIDAWNRTIEPLMNSRETAHARFVNGYREMLGVLPLELDARLIQSARRHSREMIDLGYFSHQSPTESQHSAWQRMKNAGYEMPANENLCLGRFEGEESFWDLFYSPAHHEAMVNPRYTALGVGQWENAWTQDIGRGPRLMLASDDDRALAATPGDALAPQLTIHRDRPTLDLRAFDIAGREHPAPRTRPAR
jgi:hypothetical protein